MKFCSLSATCNLVKKCYQVFSVCFYLQSKQTLINQCKGMTIPNFLSFFNSTFRFWLEFQHATPAVQDKLLTIRFHPLWIVYAIYHSWDFFLTVSWHTGWVPAFVCAICNVLQFAICLHDSCFILCEWSWKEGVHLFLATLIWVKKDLQNFKFWLK